MIFEIYPDSGFDYISEFAEKIGLQVSDNYLEIPSLLGEGFIKKIVLDDNFHLLIHKYKMKEEFTVRRLAADKSNEMLAFRFVSYESAEKEYLSNVQILNSSVDIDDHLSPDQTLFYVIFTMSKDKLLSLIEVDTNDKEIMDFIQTLNKPVLYQENVTLEMKNILNELTNLQNYGKLEKLYYKMRVVELLYLFFTRFIKRSLPVNFHTNKNDIEKIISLEKMIMKDLSVIPNLTLLSRTIGMSGTKMKSIFKKVFGKSIYNYYQYARMSEAASLLKNDKILSVSDVGIAVGYTNLSHFSRIFKKHMGVNPKEYMMEKNK